MDIPTTYCVPEVTHVFVKRTGDVRQKVTENSKKEPRQSLEMQPSPFWEFENRVFPIPTNPKRPTI